ncbi:MAG TPA: hypothetical protein VJN96_09170 [Vicinamibacterales bacterium]|nr:hypothetical protein [Vicinamibacterales bacterium]
MDFPVSYRDIRDEAIPQKDGTVLRVKRYTFDLGKFGPFTERIPLDDPNPTATLNARIATLCQHLGGINA